MDALMLEKRRTTIVIAQRLNTFVVHACASVVLTLTAMTVVCRIRHADRIVVIEKGKITEMGRHDELVARKGLYSALWSAQDTSGSAAHIST